MWHEKSKQTSLRQTQAGSHLEEGNATLINEPTNESWLHA
jgi:hypothetical protein